MKQSLDSCIRPANDLWECIPSDQTCSGPIIGGQRLEFSVRRERVPEFKRYQYTREPTSDDKDLLGIDEIFTACVQASSKRDMDYPKVITPPDQTAETRPNNAEKQKQPTPVTTPTGPVHVLDSAGGSSAPEPGAPPAAAIDVSVCACVCKQKSYHHQTHPQPQPLPQPNGDDEPLEPVLEPPVFVPEPKPAALKPLSDPAGVTTPPAYNSRPNVGHRIEEPAQKTPTTINTERIINLSRHIRPKAKAQNSNANNNTLQFRPPQPRPVMNDTPSELESISSKDDGCSNSMSMTDDNSDMEFVSQSQILYDSRQGVQQKCYRFMTENNLAKSQLEIKRVTFNLNPKQSITVGTLYDLMGVVRQAPSESQVAITSELNRCQAKGRDLILCQNCLPGDILGIYEGHTSFVPASDSALVNAATIISGSINRARCGPAVSIGEVSNKIIMAGSRFWDLVACHDHGVLWSSTGQILRSCSYKEEDIKRASGPRLAFGYWPDSVAITSLFTVSGANSEGNCGVTFIGNYMILYALYPVMKNQPIAICGEKDNENFLKVYISKDRNDGFGNAGGRESTSTPLRSFAARGPYMPDTPASAFLRYKTGVQQPTLSARRACDSKTQSYMPQSELIFGKTQYNGPLTQEHHKTNPPSFPTDALKPHRIASADPNSIHSDARAKKPATAGWTTVEIPSGGSLPFPRPNLTPAYVENRATITPKAVSKDTKTAAPAAPPPPPAQTPQPANDPHVNKRRREETPRASITQERTETSAAVPSRDLLFQKNPAPIKFLPVTVNKANDEKKLTERGVLILESVQPEKVDTTASANSGADGEFGFEKVDTNPEKEVDLPDETGRVVLSDESVLRELLEVRKVIDAIVKNFSGGAKSKGGLTPIQKREFIKAMDHWNRWYDACANQKAELKEETAVAVREVVVLLAQALIRMESQVASWTPKEKDAGVKHDYLASLEKLKECSVWKS